MENKSLGIVEISPRALAVIISIAVTEVEGVSKLIGNLKSETIDKLVKKEYFKGVRLNFDNDSNNLNVDITCSIKAGYSIKNVASEIQENIRNSVYNMTELNTDNININIISIDY